MEVFRGCVGWAGEGSENANIGDIVRAKGGLSVRRSGAWSAVVIRPVIELTILAYMILQ